MIATKVWPGLQVPFSLGQRAIELFERNYERLQELLDLRSDLVGKELREFYFIRAGLYDQGIQVTTDKDIPDEICYFGVDAEKDVSPANFGLGPIRSLVGSGS